MFLDQINLNQLRVFEAVYRTRSMTKAAQELHLTQSGISQHMRALEDLLGIKLFDRVKQKLLPTEQGKFLFKACHEQLAELEKALLKVTNQQHEIDGEVTVGMPAEFGMNIVIPLLSEFLKNNPKIQMIVKIDLAQPLCEQLLAGQIDFAFVDAFKLDSRITTEIVYNEKLELCVSENYKNWKNVLNITEKKNFEKLHYVAYQLEYPVLKMWFQHHYGFKKVTLNPKAVVADVVGVSRFITNGTGLGIMPRHKIRKMLDGGEKIHCMPTTKNPLVNSISLAYPSGKSFSPTVKFLLEWLTKEIDKVEQI